MKAAPTYLTFILILLSGTMFSQKSTTVSSNDAISKTGTLSLEMNTQSDTTDSEFKNAPRIQRKELTTNSKVVKNQKNNKLKNQAQVVYEVSEVSTPRTTIDFF